MEFLLVILLLGVFVGPSAYRLYERYKKSRRGETVSGQSGPSYYRRMLGMLGPVFLLTIFLVLLGIGLFWLTR